MTFLKNLFSYSFVLITIFVFVVSTTGFMSYTHNCEHHESQNSLAAIDQLCCSSIENTTNTVEESCCQTSVCNPEDDLSSCCSEDVNYYRLSEWYTSPVSQEKQFIFQKIILLSNIIVSAEDQLIDIPLQSDHDPGPFLKIPKYRLYSQSKLDPPIL